MFDRNLLYLDRRFVLHPQKEIRIGNCVFTKKEIEMIYIDQGLSIREFSRALGVGYYRGSRILKRFGVPTNWFSELTPRRLRVLRYIIRYKKRYKTSPTLSEIANDLDTPVSNVHFHLKNLKKYGYLDWSSKHRSIKIKKGEWAG